MPRLLHVNMNFMDSKELEIFIPKFWQNCLKDITLLLYNFVELILFIFYVQYINKDTFM